MSLDFERCVAEEYCIKVADGTHDSPKEVDYGKKLVTSKNIIGGKLDLDKSYFISLGDFDDIMGHINFNDRYCRRSGFNN